MSLWSSLVETVGGVQASGEAIERVRALLAQGPGVVWRSHFVPGHVTASALVVDRSGEHLLLIRHRFLGLWLQPGGHFEAEDASLVDAARREVIEETGVELGEVVAPLAHIDVHGVPANPKRGEPAHEHHDLRVLFRARSFSLEERAEVAGVRWVPWAEIEQIDTDASVREAARVARGLLRAGG